MHHAAARAARALLGLLGLGVAVASLWQAARLTLRPDPRDALRQADAQFVAGHYYDALARYQGLAARSPSFAQAPLRRGMVEAIRGEHEAAGRSLALALGLGLGGLDHDLARLYQGRSSAALGLRDEAAQFWATIGDDSPAAPLRRVLEADSLLRIGDYAGAEARYAAADAGAIPLDWREHVRGRLAALQAARDPDGALALLSGEGPSSGAGRSGSPRANDARAPSWFYPLVAPLLPPERPPAAQLRAALQADPAQRPQLLGQLYLDAGLYALAEAQFGAVDPGGPGALAASAYAAYTRWVAGDRAAGLQSLERLVATYPDEPRARALLALTYIAGSDTARAQQQLATIRTLSPRAPDTHLAWGQWYVSQGDYVAAADAYQRALADAPPVQRGVYALAVAEFHLDTSIELCSQGIGAAETASRLLPTEARPLVALAAARGRCGDPGGARDAAYRALDVEPANAAAAYELGRALALLGDRAGARAALISAADLAPDSDWRARAEAQLQTLGL